VFGDDGTALVYGHMDGDSCNCDNRNDTVRGGQGNDTLSSGSGADYVSGDLGEDTMTGGKGANIVHSSSDAGIDRVLDLRVAQVGADTVITMSAGSAMLVGGFDERATEEQWVCEVDAAHRGHAAFRVLTF
jgi:serralysin